MAPGDTIVQLTDASGWNESSAVADDRGLLILAYRAATGQAYDFYSRFVEGDLFDLGGVNKGANTVTLNQPLPASLGNPDDVSGVWPAGTPIANSGGGWDYKFGWCADFVPATTDDWYSVEHAIGGEDRSGRNIPGNFPPGTAKVRPVFALNYSNRPGGFGGFPDTGAQQKVWITGLHAEFDRSAAVVRQPDGSCEVSVISGDPGTGAVSMGPAAQIVSAV